MNNRNALAWLVTAAALILSFPALAQDAPPDLPIDNGFERADMDASGCIDWEEMRNLGKIVFGTLDLNHDGTIAGEEHPTARNAKGEEVTDLPSVSTAAFQAELKNAFDRADADGSGCLSEDEYDA